MSGWRRVAAPARRRPRKMATNSNDNAETGQRYAPGSAYLPERPALTRSVYRALHLLKECRDEGVTRLEAGAIGMSLPSRISDLRKLGYEIETRWEEFDDSRVGRYILLSTSMAK